MLRNPKTQRYVCIITFRNALMLMCDQSSKSRVGAGAVCIDSNKIGKGVAKGAKKKDNPFKRSLQSRKEFLLMTHDSANEQARQQPMPSLQQVEEYVLHQSQALVPVGRRRGKPATLTALHLCLGIVLCGLEGFGSQLKLWRRFCLEPIGPFAPVCVVDQAVYNRLARAAGAMRAFFE